MFGMKIWIVGITLLFVAPVFGLGMTFSVAGAIVAVIGAIAVVFDK